MKMKKLVYYLAIILLFLPIVASQISNYDWTMTVPNGVPMGNWNNIQSIFVDSSGNMLVADLTRLYLFSNTRTNLWVMDKPGALPTDTWNNIQSVYVLPDGTFYVADLTRLYKFNADRSSAWVMDRPGTPPSDNWNNIQSVDVDGSGNILVADLARLYLFDSTMKNKWVKDKPGNGAFDNWYNIQSAKFDMHGDIYVADLSTIYKYDSSGNFLWKTSTKSGIETFNNLKDMEISGKGYIYTVELTALTHFPQSPYCGNDIVDPTETCDGTNLNSKTCQTEGFTGGTLTCNSTCQLNTTSCTIAAPPAPQGAAYPTCYPIVDYLSICNSFNSQQANCAPTQYPSCQAFCDATGCDLNDQPNKEFGYMCNGNQGYACRCDCVNMVPTALGNDDSRKAECINSNPSGVNGCCLCSWNSLPPLSSSCSVNSALSCDKFDNSNCDTHSYCKWGDPPCQFIPAQCDNIPQSQCGALNPCSWSASVNKCTFDVTKKDNICALRSAEGAAKCTYDGLCKWLPPIITYTGYCGDGNIDTPNAYGVTEICDNNNFKGKTCLTEKGAEYTQGGLICSSCTSIDKSNCAIPANPLVCGQYGCQSPAENSSTCLQDCPVDGWTAQGTGWKISGYGTMTALSTDAAGTTITSDANQFSLLATKNYTLSLKVNNPGACSGTVSLSNQCLSSQGWTPQACFANIYSKPLTSTSGWQDLTISNINLSRSKHEDSNGYYRGLKIILDVTNCNAPGVSFDNITVVEQNKDGIAYDDNNAPNIDSISACCPMEWCWNGTECVNSIDWRNDSQYEPIWNSIFNLTINRWVDNHVNTTAQPKAKGYRCVLNDSGFAEWLPSDIKYDWNYKYSGYCNSQSDCFVNQTAHYVNNDNSSCIHSGEYVNDKFQVDRGNHYCLNGSWTTKSFIIAAELEKLANGQNFILFCDDPSKVFNDVKNTNNIDAACSLIIKESKTKERIILGYMLDNMHETDPTTMKLIIDRYNSIFLSMVNPVAPSSINDCDATADPDFYRCVSDSGAPQGSPHLFIYLNNRSNYFLLSDESISIIDPSFWDKVESIFNKIWIFLGFIQEPRPSTYLNYTFNYDRLYLLKNNTLSVHGLEEVRYDEQQRKLLVSMYLNYTGKDIALYNTLNSDFITDRIKPLSYYNSNAYGITNRDMQQIIIKSTKPTGLWEYLTAMLRDRDTKQ